MVNTKRYISLLVLVIALLSGCNPGIIDVPPVQVTDASKYFWNANSSQITYIDSSISTGGRFIPLALTFTGKQDTFYIHQGSNGTLSDSLTCVLGAEQVSVSGISQHTIISLPDGYVVKPVEKIITESYVPKLSRIVALSAKVVVAASDTSGIYYSSNGGHTWARSTADFGGPSNPVTALALKGDNVFAGTKSGGLYGSTNGGSSWSLFQSYGTEILAINCLPDGGDLLIGLNGKGVIRTTGNTQGTALRTSNTTKSINFKLLAASKDIIVGVTQSSLVYYRPVTSVKLDTDWHQAQFTPKSTSIRSLIATPENNFYFGADRAVYRSENGYQWSVAGDTGNSISNSMLSYDAEDHTVIAAIPEGYLFTFIDSAGKSGGFYGSVRRTITDISAYNKSFFAATDSGVYFSTNDGSNWDASVQGLSSQRTILSRIAGEIVLLRSRSGSVALDSNWEAGSIINTKLNLTIPITAHIVSHLDQVIMPDSSKYPDIIEVQYSSDITATPSWQIYYAKDIGPIIIREVSGTGVLRKIYRRK